MGDTVAGAGERVGDVGPGVDTATSAGFDDAEFGGIGGASLFGARAEAEAAGDDGVPQGAFCLVVCRRQQRIVDEGDDGGPVVEDFPGELADFLGVVIAMELARPLEPGLDRVEDGMVLVVGHGPDQVAQLTHQPRAEADAVGVEAAGQSQALPDEMGQAALAAGIIAIGAVAVGDQPTKDGLAEQVADFLVAAAADMEDGRGGARRRYGRRAGPRSTLPTASGPAGPGTTASHRHGGPEQTAPRA